jgi:hypothetical protein
MACAKPVVVSRTSAIARGYQLEDGVNCRLVPPGDSDAFEEAVLDVLGDRSQAGRSAFMHVRRSSGTSRGRATPMSSVVSCPPPLSGRAA